MKTLIAIILLLSFITFSGCGIWVIGEFTAYIVKDIPFNWWSLYSCIISFVIIISCLLSTNLD